VLKLTKYRGFSVTSRDTFSFVHSTISKDNTNGESARQAKLFAGFGRKLGSSCSHDSNDATTQFVADDAEDSSSLSPATISRDFIYDGLRYSTADPSVFGVGKSVKMVPSYYIHRNDFSGKVYTAISDSRNGCK
jgi:hypothetical protein